jgi:hypothetical protein
VLDLNTLGRPLERYNAFIRRPLAMARPSVQKLAPPLQRVGSPIGLLGLVADDVGEGVFGAFTRVRCPPNRRMSVGIRAS